MYFYWDGLFIVSTELSPKELHIQATFVMSEYILSLNLRLRRIKMVGKKYKIYRKKEYKAN